jgi:putative transposase
VGGERVERLMAQAGLSGLTPKKRGRTTIRVPGVRVADDLVDRNFHPRASDVLWVADITYLRSWEGWLYPAAVQDAFSGPIVGWSMADHMRAELVEDALAMPVARRRPEAGLVHHSDHGSQPGLNRSSQQCVREVNLGTAGDGCTRGSPRGLGWGGAAVVAEARPEAGRSGDSRVRAVRGP